MSWMNEMNAMSWMNEWMLLRASAKREASFYWYTLKIWVWAAGPPAVVTLLRGLYLWNRKPDWQAVFFGG